MTEIPFIEKIRNNTNLARIEQNNDTRLKRERHMNSAHFKEIMSEIEEASLMGIDTIMDIKTKHEDMIMLAMDIECLKCMGFYITENFLAPDDDNSYRTLFGIGVSWDKDGGHGIRQWVRPLSDID